jgi:branched-chain amino acid transport system permease protein
VYSLDLPNFGRSDRIQNISIDDYASFVKSFMKKLKIEKAVVVGHSLGGAVAMSLSYNNPQMVEKLILVDSALVDGLKTPSENYTSLSLLKNNRSLLKNALTAIMPRVIDTKLLNELTNEALLMDKKCFTENARALESYNFTDISSNFKGETLFILGKFDNLITKSMAEKTCEVINAKLEYFDNLGHSIIVENPQLFKKVVYNFTKGE